MKCYHPYAPFNPTPIYAEQHVIENGKILLNHIPYVNSIEIEGFKQTTSALISPGQFYCNYNADTYYREADCIVYFNQQHDGQTVSVDYLQVGTVITATDLNEVKEHLENGAIHNRYTLPPASVETRGGVRVGQGLSIIGDILSATAKDYTLPTASKDVKGGVKIGEGLFMDEDVLNAEPYVLPLASTTRFGGVKVGSGLSITANGILSADAQDFTLTAATRDSLGGIKVGDRLSITRDGVLSADSVAPYTLPNATNDSLGGVKVASDSEITRAIAKYFPPVDEQTELLPLLTSIPAATTDSLGGVKVGSGLSITADGILSVNAVELGGYVLPPASTTQLGGVKVGSGLTIVDGVLSANTVTAASDEEISDIIQNYFASTLSGGD